MVAWKFREYLQEVLLLPSAVYESPSFHYTDQISAEIFCGVKYILVIIYIFIYEIYLNNFKFESLIFCYFFFYLKNGKVTVNDFMDSMMSDPGPACLVWLPLLHRLANVENGW